MSSIKISQEDELMAGQQEKVARLKFQDKKYKIILADPPWIYNGKLGTNRAKMGGYDKYYKGMELKDICNLPIQDIADDNCILFLWATMPKLQEAFEVIKAWGFTHKTTAFTWIKLNPKSNTIFKGVGRWVMGNAELVLLATKGKPKRVSKSVSQIIMAKRGKHSKKPDIVYRRIEELMGNLPRIELFARNKRQGWDAWGNQVPTECQNLILEVSGNSSQS